MGAGNKETAERFGTGCGVCEAGSYRKGRALGLWLIACAQEEGGWSRLGTYQDGGPFLVKERADLGDGGTGDGGVEKWSPEKRKP